MGLPVVISDNGIPVVDVTGVGAGLLMTVAENGFGTPVTIAENGYGLAAVFDPPLGPLPPPTFTTGTTVSRVQGNPLAFPVVTTPSSTKAITGGADAARFVLVNGGISATGHLLSWVDNAAQAPGAYVVQITATNATDSTNQTITVTVTETPTPPTVVATVSGSPNVDSTLTCSTSGTTGSAPISYAYLWYRTEAVDVLTDDAGDVLTDDDGEELTT